MAQQKTAEVSEAEIAVHWQEEAHIQPPKKFVVQANLADRKIRHCVAMRPAGILPVNRKSPARAA